ncbi:hypothetical protein LXT21_44050 [Myxococcus sp. K38C18041901]|uniref:hypothetical protein n=1 Tax=Myxococcus guangdongensis TaxID=2906760 RepID=UPI0020A7864C|nr:hypothetical protein [Myxococcus guangdongensis]MCP3065762.1 hypothetical protein [Myxococcus guangdongensis]
MRRSARRYASKTSVPVHKSRAQIEELLDQHGADPRQTSESRERGEAVVTFRLENRVVRFRMPLPQLELFTTRKVRGQTVKATPEQQRTAYEQACRESWRALHAALKAKFISLEGGIETFEQAFLAHVVTADGHTVGEHVLPALEASYRTGKVLPLLMPGEPKP